MEHATICATAPKTATILKFLQAFLRLCAEPVMRTLDVERLQGRSVEQSCPSLVVDMRGPRPGRAEPIQLLWIKHDSHHWCPLDCKATTFQSKQI